MIAAGDPDRVATTIATVVGSLVLHDPEREVLVLDGGGSSSSLACLSVLGSVADVITHRESDRLARAVALLEGRRREVGEGGDDGPLVVVVNRWGPIADALGDVLGPEAPAQLARLFGDGSIVPIFGVTSDREMPSKALALARRRLVHRLGDANAGLAFDMHPSKMPLGGAEVYDVESRLSGVIADLSPHGLARIAAWSVPAKRPDPVRILADRMERASLPEGACNSAGDVLRWSVPIAFDEDLRPVSAELSAGRPFIVLGRPGSGRSTAIDTIRSGLDRLGVCGGVEIIDDADRCEAHDIKERLAVARSSGRPVVLSATPAVARVFGSWLAPLIGDSTVLLLNPSRLDGEALRVVVPDLSNRPPGRSVLIDGGQATIVHVAMDTAA